MSTTEELIRQCYAAYVARDRSTFESLLADDYTFSSPLDDNIDKAAFMERCWPNGENHRNFRIERIFVEGDEGFVTYHCERVDGGTFRNTEFFKVHDGKIRHVDVYFGSDTASSANEAAVREIIEGTVEACREGDTRKLLKDYAPDLVAFDLISPLQYNGAETVGQRAKDWLDSFEGPIQYDLAELKIATGDEAAFCHSLNHVSGIKKVDGKPLDMWWRATLGFQLVEGEWKVTHSHASIPFDSETGNASLELKP
jgi:ketosteroid isomerase-like protein